MNIINNNNQSNQTQNTNGAAVLATPNPTPAVDPPPNPSTVPVPPAGFVPPHGSAYGGAYPRRTELAAMPQALTDLMAFVDYDVVLGAGAPPAAKVTTAVNTAQKWSAVRNAAHAWDQYCSTEEGMAWTILRSLMADLAPVFRAAVKAKPSLATQYPGLAALLAARKAISKKAVATKAANDKANAEGKPANHGAVGKKRRKAAAYAALAAQEAAHAPPTPVTPPAPVSPATPAKPPST